MTNNKLENTALRLLSLRDHTRSELSTKLRQRGFGPEEINTICDKLLELGYLDDARVAQSILNRAIEQPVVGPRKLQEKLLRRGIGTESVRQAINSFMENVDEKEAVYNLAEQLVRQGKSPDYILRRLYRKGFSRSAIAGAADKLRLDNHGRDS